MFLKELEERLAQLDNQKVFRRGELWLEERQIGGEVNLKIESENPCIVFTQADKNKWPYLSHKSCADHFILEYKENRWRLHVLEFKTTVTPSKWMHIKDQFKGAVLNGLAAVGFLNISLEWEDVTLYTCYRKDNIQNPIEFVELRAEMTGADHTDTSDWLKGRAALQVLDCTGFSHRRIALDSEEGTGCLRLA